jgi:hypothetical protein
VWAPEVLREKEIAQKEEEAEEIPTIFSQMSDVDFITQSFGRGVQTV